MINRLIWIIAIAVFVMLPITGYAQVTINYLGVSIRYGNQTYVEMVNVTSNQLVIPIYQYCAQGNVLFSAYLDPLSSLGITSISGVLYNGSTVNIPVIDYSPKYVSIEVNCSLPIYGIYLGLNSYGPYPLEALVVPGSNITYTLTQGSINISIPSIPGLNYLFSIIKLISISPATAGINNYLTAELGTEYSSVNIGSISTYAEITTYITYSSSVSITANGTTYVVITPYYYAPITSTQNLVLTTSSNPFIMLTGAPWIKYSYNNCTLINPGIPRITPWTTYLAYTPYCTVAQSVESVIVNIVGESKQNLMCDNVFITAGGNSIIGLTSNLTINPVMDRTLYVTISGVKTIGIRLNSIPTSTVTVSLPLIPRSSLSIIDEAGNPVNALIYLNINGTLIPLSDDSCIYPGNYDVYALVNNELVNLGLNAIYQGSSLEIPIFLNYTLNISIPEECPDLNLELLVKYGNYQYAIPMSGNNQVVSIPNAMVGRQVQVELLGNGSLLYQRVVTINGSGPGSLVIKPRMIDFVPIDLLNNELPNAVLNIGSLYYVGPGRYCVPVNSSVGMVIYGSDIYIVNITGGNVYVRVWTLGPLGIKTLLVIFGLLTLLMIIASIVRGLGGKRGGDNDEYIIIR